MNKERLADGIDFLKSYFVVGILVILSLHSGLRSGNDPDYLNYLHIFNMSVHLNADQLQIEPFYLWFNYLFKALNCNFSTLLISIAFLAISVKFWFIYKISSNIFLSLCIYVCTIYFLYDVIAIRQGISIAFVMVSTLAIINGNLLFFCSLILIASLFHVSAVLMLPLYWVVNRSYNLLFLGFILLLCIVVNLLKIEFSLIDAILKLPLIPSFVVQKINIYLESSSVAFLSVKQLLIGGIAIFIYRLDTSHKLMKCFCLVYILGALICTLCATFGELSFRLRWYFFWTEIFIVPYICNYCYEKSGSLMIYLLLILCFCYVYINSLMTIVSSLQHRGYQII